MFFSQIGCQMLKHYLLTMFFHIVFKEQGIGDLKSFPNIFKERVIDVFNQSCAGITLQNTLLLYGSFKQSVEFKAYLYSLPSRFSIYTFANFILKRLS